MGSPVVLDCDNAYGLRGAGVGDGLALLALLGSRGVDLIGVTTTFGTAPVDVVYRETKRFLALLGREEIPVFRGAPWPGYRPTEAAHFLARSARERPGEITVACTGPLANLHAATEVSRSFFSEVGRVAFAGGMGGRVRVGWSRLREVNVAADPMAASGVLRSRRPLTVLTGELCAGLLFRPRDFDVARGWPSWARRPLAAWMRAAALRGLRSGVPLWDLLPAAYVLRPDLFEDRIRYNVSEPEELAKGLLRLTDRAVGPALNAPVRVRNPDALRSSVVARLDGAARDRRA